MNSTMTGIALFALLAQAAVWDVRSKRIPNPLTIGGFLVAIALRAGAGWTPVLDGLLAAGVGLAVAVPLLALRAIGGGDAKLLVATAAFLGPDAFPPALLYTALAGGGLALLTAVRLGLLPLVLRNCGALVVHLATLGKRGVRPTLAAPGALTVVPYGLAIAVGSLVAWTLAGAQT